MNTIRLRGDTYTSDADGNTLLGGGRTNTWDSQNRLASCTKNTLTGTTATFNATYAYVADGLRRRAFTPQQGQPIKRGPATQGLTADDPELDTALDLGTSYAYDGTMLVREGHARSVNGVSSLQSANVTATYLIGARGPEYRRDDTAQETDSQGRTVTKARWYVYDGLGSVVGEVDPSGNLTSSPKYDVYGAVRSNGGSATSRQGFVGSLGHVSDDTGLIYMRARYMDPSTGRFMSEDPACDGNNWFAYCGNNPINEADATGKIGQGLIDAIISALIDSNSSFSGTGKLAGMSNDAAIDFIEAKIQQLKTGELTNGEMAAEFSAFALQRKTIGDEDGAAFYGGLADQEAKGAAEKVVAMEMLNEIADQLVMEQMEYGG